MLQTPVREFFDAYEIAFAEGATAIAAFYAIPCVFARGGVVRFVHTDDDFAELGGQIDAQYRERGFHSAKYVALGAQDLGINSKFVTLRWAYLDKTDSTIWETTFSYNLYKQKDGWKVLMQTIHDQ